MKRLEPTDSLLADRKAERNAWGVMILVGTALQVLLMINTQFPYVIESGDNASILYVIAHWLNPAAFTEDALLGVAGSTDFYQAAPMWLIYFLGLSGAQVGLFFVLLCFPVAMMQMSGFYVLGKRLFDSRGVAVALALISLPTVFTLAGDLWGLSHSPLFRSIYSAAFPWLLLLLIDQRGTRPFVLMLASALATYMHLPSGPPIALVLLAVSFFRDCANRDLLRSVLVHVGAGVFYLALVLPYAALFSLNYATGSEQSHAVFNDTPYTDVRIAIEQLLSMRGPERMGVLVSRVPELSWAKPIVAPFFAVLYLLGSITLTALCVVWMGPRHWRQKLGLSRHENWLWVAALFVGVVVFALAISALDQSVARLMDRAPVQIDFVRATRFIVPGAYLGVFFLFVWATQRTALLGPASCIVVTAVVWLVAFPSTSHGLYRLAKRQSIEDPSLTQLGQFVLALPDKKRAGLITPILRYDYQSSALRYIAYLPLSFNRKDNNFISYSGKSDLERHLTLMEHIDEIRRARLEPTRQAQRIAAFVDDLKAPNVVIDRRVVRTDAETILVERHGFRLVYETELFALFEPEPFHSDKARQ